MRRPILYVVAAAMTLAFMNAPAQAGIFGTLKAKSYAALAKVQSILPLPGLSHPCASCGVGIPVPKFTLPKIPSLHKRRCIDPIRSPRDFFMLR